MSGGGSISDHHDAVTYSLLESGDHDDHEEEEPVRHVPVSRTMSRSSTVNTFAGRLRGSQRIAFLIFLSVFLLLIVWLLSNMEPSPERSKNVAFPSSQQDSLSDNLNPFLTADGSRRPSDLKIKSDLGLDWYENHCYKPSQLGISISDVYQKIQLLKGSKVEECHKIWTIFDSMLRMEAISAPISLPGPFQTEVKGWLNNNEELFEQVNHQIVYKVVNKGTFEETVFNPIRSNRPVSKPARDPLEYIQNLTDSTKSTCDFCKFETNTAADTFGRVNSTYSASASNTFKLAKFHGLFFPKQHHPLNLSLVQLGDLFINTSLKWFSKAHAADAEQRYPSLMWDTLPHAGASQVHPHVHGVLDAYQYVGGMESWHQLSINYFKKYRRSFWTDFIKLHFALGLGISLDKAVALVPITARKDHEYMILSTDLNEDTINFIYNILQAYQKKLGVYCFSSGGVYPKLGPPGPDDDTGMPVIFRIGSRGICTSIGSDVSSLELYTINNINSDIAKTYKALKDRFSS